LSRTLFGEKVKSDAGLWEWEGAGIKRQASIQGNPKLGVIVPIGVGGGGGNPRSGSAAQVGGSVLGGRHGKRGGGGGGTAPRQVPGSFGTGRAGGRSVGNPPPRVEIRKPKA